MRFQGVFAIRGKLVGEDFDLIGRRGSQEREPW
jgi:hypothetical protein